jgi:DNA helicase HerA-like ATPase
MPVHEPTFVGNVAAVKGAVVHVRLRDDISSTLLMVEGESYRVGQIGEFFRVPLGYTQLYAVCTQVGATAIPGLDALGLAYEDIGVAGYRWMTITLFGESVGGHFDRGVGQYPTIGDEIHLVTHKDLETIYGTRAEVGELEVGSIAASSGISARLDVAALVSRHACVVGSTGSGKSNLVTVLVESLATGGFPRARILVVDPHGEYGEALARHARVFKVGADAAKGESELRVPFWALPMEELFRLTTGELQPNVEAAVRDQVLELKIAAARELAHPPSEAGLTADSPVPFSIKKLWFDLDSFERLTFSAPQQGPHDAYPPEEEGSIEDIRSNRFPAASPYNTAPYYNKQRRNISRQLDLFASRLRDTQLSFTFDPGGGYSPTEDGRIDSDLDVLVSQWIGHDRPVTILDVSGVPSDVLPAIVGTMLRVMYDVLFWSMNLPIGGRQQPLLVVLEEAHRFLGEADESAAHRINRTIAKEGRKYGVGLVVVSQRPSEIDSTVLSQCGTMIALRLTNAADRNRVSSAFPDDLGELVDMLPALRTGEGLFLGEALKLPTRVRIRKAGRRPVGDDPLMPNAWIDGVRPDQALYRQGLANWRARSTAAAALVPEEEEEDT